MDFNDTQEEAAFRAEVQAWLAANAERMKPREHAPGLEGRAEPGAITRAQAWQARKADAGWACITWPKEYGGRSATPIQGMIWNQEESHYRVPPNVFAIGHGMLGPTIMVHGTDEQKQRYLRPMLRGEEIWCQLFSEPSAGSDLAGLRTSAVRDGDDWTINGQKIWTTGAQYCKWGMIVTRTDPSAEKHRGITYFIVDMQAPGIEIRPIKQINGQSGFNEVFFTDVRVPDKCRVGAVNDGWRGAITTLMNERASIGGGIGGGPDFTDLLRLAKETQCDGRSALEDRSVRQRLARFYIRLKGLQYTGYRTQTALSRGAIPGPARQRAAVHVGIGVEGEGRQVMAQLLERGDRNRFGLWHGWEWVSGAASSLAHQRPDAAPCCRYSGHARIARARRSRHSSRRFPTGKRPCPNT